MRRALALFAILFVAVLSGCSDATGPNATITGTYALQTINGKPLPYLEIDEPGYREELITEELTLRETGSFTIVSTYRVNDDGFISNYSESDGGTFSRNGTAVTLAFDGGGSITGSYSDNSLFFGVQGFSFVYTR